MSDLLPPPGEHRQTSCHCWTIYMGPGHPLLKHRPSCPLAKDALWPVSPSELAPFQNPAKEERVRMAKGARTTVYRDGRCVKARYRHTGGDMVGGAVLGAICFLFVSAGALTLAQPWRVLAGVALTVGLFGWMWWLMSWEIEEDG